MPGNHAVVDFSNYIGFMGVRPGLNTLTFKVQEFEGRVVENVVILPDSGIEYSPTSPPSVQLEIKAPDGPVRIGHTIVVPYKLINSGDTPAQDVKVGILNPTQGLVTVGGATHEYESLTGEVENAFVVEASPGVHRLVVGAESRNGRPFADFVIEVLETEQSSGTGAARWVMAPILGVVLLAAWRWIKISTRP